MIKQIKLRKDEKEKLNEKRKYYLVDANKLYFINKEDNLVYILITTLRKTMLMKNIEKYYFKLFL